HMPQRWTDLANPYWKGKLTIDNLEVSGTGYNWLTSMVSTDGVGWPFIEALGRNAPGLERGHAGMAQKVAGGEYAAAPGLADFRWRNPARSGRSVARGGVWPRDGVPQEPGTAGILKRAPHPNAARLFLDFLLSREGQTLYVKEMGWASARADVPPPDDRD